jgi:hypothetical protein
MGVGTAERRYLVFNCLCTADSLDMGHSRVRAVDLPALPRREIDIADSWARRIARFLSLRGAGDANVPHIASMAASFQKRIENWITSYRSGTVVMIFARHFAQKQIYRGLRRV